MLFLVVDMSKESAIGTSGAMTLKGTNTPVQTASAEMNVVGGQLMTRAAETCGAFGNETCGSAPLETTTSTPTMGLSSLISIDELMHLDSMKISQNGATLIFKVEAVARFPDPLSRYGDVVIIYTHLGEITLDGSALYFHERIAHTFSRAGFAVDQSTNRRLLGAAEVLGMFKKINAAVANSPGLQEIPTPLPMTFSADIVERQACRGIATPGQNLCVNANTGPVNWVTNHPETGEAELLLRQTMYFMTINGLPVSKGIASKAQYPGQQFTEVQNSTHKLLFQTYNEINYNCHLEEDDSLSEVLSQRRVLHDIARRALDPLQPLSIAFAGWDVFDGVYCGHYIITDFQVGVLEQHLIHMYEDWVERKLFKIVFGETTWEFTNMVEITSEDQNPLTAADVDIDAIWDSCDPHNIIPPPRIELGIITNVVSVSPDWGTLAINPVEFVLNTSVMLNASYLAENNMTGYGSAYTGTTRRSQTGNTGGTEDFDQWDTESAVINMLRHQANTEGVRDGFGQLHHGIDKFTNVIYLTEEAFAERQKSEKVRLAKILEQAQAEQNELGYNEASTRRLFECQFPWPDCLGFELNVEQMGLAIAPEYCHGKSFSISMSIDFPKFKNYVNKIVVVDVVPMCPAPAGSISVSVPFDDPRSIFVAGSVTATFPLGDCVSLYGMLAGIPPQVGDVLEMLGIEIDLTIGVDIGTIEETCGPIGQMGKILFAPIFYAQAAIGATPPFLNFESPVGGLGYDTADDDDGDDSKKKAKTRRKMRESFIQPADGSPAFYHLPNGGKADKHFRPMIIPRVGLKRHYARLSTDDYRAMIVEGPTTDGSQRRRWAPNSAKASAEKVKSTKMKEGHRRWGRLPSWEDIQRKKREAEAHVQKVAAEKQKQLNDAAEKARKLKEQAEEQARKLKEEADRKLEEAKRKAAEAAAAVKKAADELEEAAKKKALEVAAAAQKVAAAAAKVAADAAAKAAAAAQAAAKFTANLAAIAGQNLMDLATQGITVSATGWVKIAMVPTIGCPAMKQKFHWGTSISIGMDAQVMSFKKSYAFDVVPLGTQDTCAMWGDSPFYNYGSDSGAFAMLEVPPIKIGGDEFRLPCIPSQQQPTDKEAREYCDYHADIGEWFKDEPDYKCREHYYQYGIWEHRHWPNPPADGGPERGCAFDFGNTNGWPGGPADWSPFLKNAFCDGGDCYKAQHAARLLAFYTAYETDPEDKPWPVGMFYNKDHHHRTWTCDACAIDFCNTKQWRVSKLCGAVGKCRMNAKNAQACLTEYYEPSFPGGAKDDWTGCNEDVGDTFANGCWNGAYHAGRKDPWW
mmetsp:Transcript_42092/g.95926  ORF Transcript_42092/g.95926 Transcript_42092/m.95926 type:complete len:1311 (+) Transcript_42092:667-4599(+)